MGMLMKQMLHITSRKPASGHVVSLSMPHGSVVAVQKADIWSCGIILYAMLYGQHPFQARDPTFAQKVVRGDYPVPVDIPVSPPCLGLLKGILVPNPRARMSMADIKQHPWFLQGDHCC